jgi:hypothetical protein
MASTPSAEWTVGNDAVVGDAGYLAVIDAFGPRRRVAACKSALSTAARYNRAQRATTCDVLHLERRATGRRQ